MANISEAVGFFELTGDWSDEDIENFVYIYKTQEGYGDYCFWDQRSPELIIKELQSYRSTGFLGSGRWSFINNLMSFKTWVINSGNDKYPDAVAKITALLKSMEEKNLTIHFEFYDCDPCMDYYAFITGELNSKLEWDLKSEEGLELNLVSYAKHIYEGETLAYIKEEICNALYHDISEYDIDAIVLDVFNHPTGYGLPTHLDEDDFENIYTEFYDMIKEKYRLN